MSDEKPDEFADAQILQAWRSYLPRWDAIRAGLRAALWSAPFGLVVFVFLYFSPWTGIVSVSTQPPLRVTWLYVEPTPEGFRIEGDVWNQSKGPLSVRAAVVLLDASGKQVGGGTALIEPQPLRPREQGAILTSVGAYPGATDFALRFFGEDDQALGYAKGFPGTAPEQDIRRSIRRTDTPVKRRTR